LGGAVPAGGGFGGDSGMNPNQRAVLDLMLSMPENNTDTGCNINQVGGWVDDGGVWWWCVVVCASGGVW
jgi:hypothetical protein